MVYHPEEDQFPLESVASCQFKDSPPHPTPHSLHHHCLAYRDLTLLEKFDLKKYYIYTPVSHKMKKTH